MAGIGATNLCCRDLLNRAERNRYRLLVHSRPRFILNVCYCVLQIHLGDQLEAPLIELGVTVVGDLLLLEEEDITALKVPLKKVQTIKFQSALSDTLSKLRKAEAAELGEDFDRYWQ